MIHDHEARKSRVGASEVAAILGLNEYQTPLDVWMVKTGRKPHFEGNEHTRRGQRQEAQILEWLAEDLGKIVDPSIGGFGLVQNEIAAATPDALVYPARAYSGIDLHSVKVYAKNDFLKFSEALAAWFPNGPEIELAETKSTLKTIRDESEIPLSWLIQCQWQMMVTGLKKCHLGIFGPMVSNYQRFEIAFNQEFADELLAQVTEWWEVHIVGDKMPEPISEGDVCTLWPIDDGTTIEAVPTLADAIMQHSELKAIAKELEAKIKPLRERIVLAIGRSQAVHYGGRTIATYKAASNGSRIFRTY